MDNDNNFVYLPQGTKLNGRYIIERIIGQGGFGITYYARHEMLEHFYAIKEFYISGFCSRNTSLHTVNLQGMNPDMYEKYKQRFVEEAKTVVSLDHPNIVKVVDIFEENNTAYMVMPFIEGISLQKMVEKNGTLPYELTVNYIGQLSNAVGYIHQKHILHRDIKPDNVLVTPDNRVVLIDFGSARAFVNDQEQRHTSILTHGYAPPEQYNAVSKKGNYTDIYAIGGVFYFCLTGQIPVDATTRLLELAGGKDPLKQPKDMNPEVSEDVNRTIMKAMSLKPENRHQTVAEFMDDLLGRNKSEVVDDALEMPDMPEDDALEMPDDMAQQPADNADKGYVSVFDEGTKPKHNNNEPAKGNEPEKKKKKGKGWLVWLIILVVLGVGGIVGWNMYQRYVAEQLAQEEYEVYSRCTTARGCRAYLEYYPNGTYYWDVTQRLEQFVADSIEEVQRKIYGDKAAKGFMDMGDVIMYAGNSSGVYNGNPTVDKYDASQLFYIIPKVKYKGLLSDEIMTITIYSKLYDPNGGLLQNNNSPKGYTCSDVVNVRPGNNKSFTLKGFGYDSAGYFISGEYTWEIWYNGKKLRTKKFRVVEQRPVIAINVNGVAFDMVRVEGGTFTMGCTSEQGEECLVDETPAHSVTLSNNYYIGKYEVTNELWYAVMGYYPTQPEGDNMPVGAVSWNNCQQFVNKLSQLTGKKFRLPTEAEWEFAARGGNMSRGYKYSGSNNINDVAWYIGNTDGRPRTVGYKQANELGIYDMTGNIYEFCSDWFGDYSSDSQTNPTGPASGNERVIRGGCAGYEPQDCRVTCRNGITADDTYTNVGLRLVMEL